MILHPPQAPKCGATHHRLNSGDAANRFTHSEQPTAHGTEGSAHSLSASPRHPCVLFAPSALRSFGCIHLRFVPMRHHRTLPLSNLDLINLHQENGTRRAKLATPISRARLPFDRTSLCIFRRDKGIGRNPPQGGGGCIKPLRGQAPEPPKRLLHSRLASTTHYKPKKV